MGSSVQCVRSAVCGQRHRYCVIVFRLWIFGRGSTLPVSNSVSVVTIGPRPPRAAAGSRRIETRLKWTFLSVCECGSYQEIVA